MLWGQILIFSSLLPYIYPSTETRKWNGSPIKKRKAEIFYVNSMKGFYFFLPLASQINPKKQSTLCNTDFSLGNVVSSFSTSAVKTYCHPSFAKWFLERPSNEYLAYRGLMYWEPGLVLWKRVSLRRFGRKVLWEGRSLEAPEVNIVMGKLMAIDNLPVLTVEIMGRLSCIAWCRLRLKIPVLVV